MEITHAHEKQLAALRNGRVHYLKKLFGNLNADPTHAIGCTPLLRAAEGGDETVVKQLLENGGQPNSKDDKGQTPLSFAAWKGHEAVVKLVLENGGNKKVKGEKGMTKV